ncbi:MAG: adenylosuccinate synthase [Calditrichaceae bacterium]
MSVKIVVGSQWGDEGKGKIIDVLSETMDLVIRYQGGANAGHTVCIGEDKYVLHLLPSGILRPGVKCIIGGGVVLDPEAFQDELNFLKSVGVDYQNRLMISPRTHVIFPYHKMLDKLSETGKGKEQIGTTGRGIGPAYTDKYSRMGIRAVDLINDDIRNQRLKENISQKNFLFEKYYKSRPIELDEILNTGAMYAEIIRPYVTETVEMVNHFLRQDKNILLEGAQGALLDIDYGSYPYVTSSHTISGGGTIGSGVPVTSVDGVTGVMKAYLTRVGNGPFPTEEDNQTGQKLRDIGAEYGATTGRPRRCGWLDLVAARYSVQINGITDLALTKLDVLDQFEKIYVCTSYKHKNHTLNTFPADQTLLSEIEPVYEELPGWKESINSIRSFNGLPLKTRNYIKYIEDFCSVPVKYISVGHRREEIIIK